MKILRIIARLNVGGPARHVVWLTNGLNDDEFQSLLVAGTVPPGEEDMSYFAAENRVSPVFIAELSRELSPKDIISLWKVYCLMREFSPDVVHTHTAKAGTIGRGAAFLYRWLSWRTLIGHPRKLKVVHTFHGHVFHSYYGAAKTCIFLTIERMLARFATHRIITISRQQFHEINGDFGVGRAEQFSVIPLGIDLSQFDVDATSRAVLRDEIAVSDDEMIVGFVGRLTAIKNIPMLLEAAAAITGDPKSPKMRFVIIGDGELRGELESTTKDLGIERAVTFLGNRTDVSALLPGMDIIALTSANEGTPLSLIEAMAAGVPFVSTAVGGVIDLAGEKVESRDGYDVCERGITTTPGSSTAFANALIHLANDEKLRMDLAREGREFVVANYSTERLVSDIKRLYRELAP